jgi:hypothetical protein
MAYDRYDSERRRREHGERGSHGRDRDRDREREYREGGDDRGFFGRMGEEVRSWFGDEDRERGRDDGRERGRDEDSAWRPADWSSSERDYNRDYREELDRGYRPMAGDHGRSGGGSDGRGSRWEEDEYRRTSFAGSRANSNHDDLHYSQWRRRQVEDLDQEYDEYRRECVARFEDDFGSWRRRRQEKRQLLGSVREQMEVVASDGEHLGTVERIAGDRIILTGSGLDEGGAHHSLGCTDVERFEGDRVILAITASQARERWQRDGRGRALFEREDQGSGGPHVLDRSFPGTYRDR